MSCKSHEKGGTLFPLFHWSIQIQFQYHRCGGESVTLRQMSYFLELLSMIKSYQNSHFLKTSCNSHHIQDFQSHPVSLTVRANRNHNWTVQGLEGFGAHWGHGGFADDHPDCQGNLNNGQGQAYDQDYNFQIIGTPHDRQNEVKQK